MASESKDTRAFSKGTILPTSKPRRLRPAAYSRLTTSPSNNKESCFTGNFGELSHLLMNLYRQPWQHGDKGGPQPILPGPSNC